MSDPEGMQVGAHLTVSALHRARALHARANDLRTNAASANDLRTNAASANDLRTIWLQQQQQLKRHKHES
jgi:hypothetical protein